MCCAEESSIVCSTQVHSTCWLAVDYATGYQGIKGLSEQATLVTLLAPPQDKLKLGAKENAVPLCKVYQSRRKL